MKRIVVIGAGQAGAAAAAKARETDPEAAITLIGVEPEPPYQRPPLSKAYLTGDLTRERLYLRPLSFYAQQRIALVLGQGVAQIDRHGRTVVLDDGTRHRFDGLVLTTGSLARRLPAALGGTLDGVHVVRTLADVDLLTADLVPGRRMLVVGGGYIGLEAAAVARKVGLDVTLIESADRILRRVACAETSDFFRALHREHGVDLREGAQLAGLDGAQRVERARFADGSTLRVDLVVVGIGVTPATALAEAAGLTIDNGIAVDRHGRTSDPAIWAAGDCASFPWRGQRIRLESVQNAIDQAECVAANIAGAARPYDPVPWFWSDQYDVKLQIAGLNTGWTGIVARPGSRPGTASHWYFRQDALISVDAMNDPRAYMIGKRLIEAGARPDPALLSDAGRDLKALLPAA